MEREGMEKKTHFDLNGRTETSLLTLSIVPATEAMTFSFST